MNLEETESLSEQIVKYISEQIISGELVEGERIQELRIAKELDVSRGSVREALLLLERTHLIEIFPRRGAIVSEMSAQQVKALFDTNMMLLGHIVQRISETWRAHEADQLQLLLEQLLEHVKAGDIEKFYDAIFQYLAEQQDMVGNPYLMKFYKELLPSLRRSYFLTLNTSKRELQEAFALFKLVTDAILIRKSQQAALFMEDFCRHLRNLVLESLTRMKQIELAWARRSRR
ncbi:TPA: GntR family transcriptional regulator [Acinetobacter baumannii]|jgi:DNA-binding GntR family transcriptional regulator|uniref:HTH gntR-type domain-containing protein n=35 Tax=Gammaproteobacteria TaxID=1236 RepID=A0ABX6CCG8_ACIB2|nr:MULTISPECIES: GntR family transcriptional regulator [Acinetobacter]ADX91222.1 transcriptional regulator [Acinetobacter baumannii TCDC-AB0715]AHX28286.1 GntR family transcriptional regulator [Acinetobacter baumannii AC12]AHX65101.1 GntR family transcriptional regulator [Acinetobacter baumannii AC30]EMT87923.1 transcriptional regulator [Acinetobacter baumannii ABNIH5]EMT97264.1 transcriptional regulator [Acinetobacter baumannii ABNIH6]EMU18133.1 transcriptional regulator [Acinetobacter bauma